MKIFGFNLNVARTKSPGAVQPTATKSFAPTAAEWLRGQDLDQSGAVLTNAYQQVVWVYRAINVLAEQVANIPFLFSAGERGRENLITRGPLLDFYARPHPHINRFQYWELRIIWLMLRGECFRIPIYSDSSSVLSPRRLDRVLILDPIRFQHIVRDHELVGWRYTGLGPETPLASQVFLPEEVWHEKLPNPFDFWRGLPPLYAASMAARTDFAAGAFMRGIIENNADTGLIVRTDKPLDPEQQEQLWATLRERKRRAGQADRPTLITGVNEIIRPELSSSDLQFLENRKFSRAEICAAFGVPEEVLTATDHAKYDVMQGARLNFMENRVAPLCGRLEAEEDIVVKSLDPEAIGWFDVDSLPIMQQARRNRLAAARAGFDMGVPFNELNRVLDLGFKALPWGNQGYVPAGMRNVGKDETIESRADARPRSARTTAESQIDPVTRLDRLFTALRGFEHAAGPGSPAPALATPDAVKFHRFLFEQRGRALQALEKLTTDGVPCQPGSLLDLCAENALLAARVGCASVEGSPLAAFNQATLEALREALKAGKAVEENPTQLAARVREVFNQAASAADQNRVKRS